MPDGFPPWLDDEGELEVAPPLEGDGMPPDVLGDPELPLDGELGTGTLGVLGWLITEGVRQPDSSTDPPRAAIATRNVVPWTFIRYLPALASGGPHHPETGLPLPL